MKKLCRLLALAWVGCGNEGQDDGDNSKIGGHAQVGGHLQGSDVAAKLQEVIGCSDGSLDDLENGEICDGILDCDNATEALSASAAIARAAT